MNAITLIWRQVLKELKLFQMKKNKEDAAEKTEEEQLKTPESEGHEDIYCSPARHCTAYWKKERDGTKTTGPPDARSTYIPAKTV